MKVIFVTGKGGVGKSTVVASLASALASQNYKTGVVELGQTRMADFFKTPPPDYDGVSLNSFITLYNLNPLSSFEEYAGLHLPKQILFFLKNRFVQHFVDAVPGLNEILLLGKMMSLAQETSWDFLLVDLPATGHAVSLFDAPRTALNTLKHGPLKATIENIWKFLHNEKKAHFWIVTKLEDFIVEETLELYRHLIQNLNFNVERMVVNGVTMDNGGASCIQLAPQDHGPKPLTEILKWAERQKTREKKLLEKLQKEIPLKLETLSSIDETLEESDLKLNLAKEMKAWALKNSSRRRAS